MHWVLACASQVVRERVARVDCRDPAEDTGRVARGRVRGDRPAGCTVRVATSTTSKGLEPDAAESESDTGFSRPHLFMVRRGRQGLGAGCRRAVGGRRRRSEAGALAVWRGALFPDGRGWPCCGSAACKQLVGLRGWSCSCVQAAGGAAWLVMQLRASSWWSLISCVIGAIAARNPQTVANAPQHTPTDSCSLPFGI